MSDWVFRKFKLLNQKALKLKVFNKNSNTCSKTYEVCRVQDPVLHWVGQVQGELPDSSLFGLLANGWPLLFDL